jgi:F0F1-type ATP synthase membrane subunit b/b'
MSDMLERLLGVEKSAAALVAEAEAEAARMTSQARNDAQREYAEALKVKAAEMEHAIVEAKESLAAERARATAAYRDLLATRAPDEEGFRRAALSFIDKGLT